ncbi:hypothetical protein TWF481_010376 [Arthrobotrys musiformis]|uniref:Uncharacterized protein n=1 Tax=Arthrobotrys musiformis TaxID=47236 RepID=A0AAV9W0P9_9PEZI
MGKDANRRVRNIPIFGDDVCDSSSTSQDPGERYYKSLTAGAQREIDLAGKRWKMFHDQVFREKVCSTKAEPSNENRLEYITEIPENYNFLDPAVMTHVEIVFSYLKWILHEYPNIKQPSRLMNCFNGFRSFYHWKAGGRRYPSEAAGEITEKLKPVCEELRRLYCADDKPKVPITGSDLIKIVQYNWESDTHKYLHERYRVQLALAIHILGFTAIRPGSFVQSENRIRRTPKRTEFQKYDNPVRQDQFGALTEPDRLIEVDGLNNLAIDEESDDSLSEGEDETKHQVLLYRHVKIYVYRGEEAEIKDKICMKVSLAVEYHKDKRGLEMYVNSAASQI